MLEAFAKHLELAKEILGDRVPEWYNAFEPAKLAKMLVFSFLEDIEVALIPLPHSQIELHGVGSLQRVKEEIVFSPDPLFDHEVATRQFLLDGAFWKVICGVETEREIFFVPLRLNKTDMGSTAYLCTVAECMLTIIQRDIKSFHDISLDTLWCGLCLAVHDAICGGTGMYLEKIGTFLPSGCFVPDPYLLKKIKGRGESDCEEQFPLVLPASRRQTNNRGWYRSDRQDG